MHIEPETRIVNAPGEYANSMENGSVALVLWENATCVQTALLTGPNAGREWQFRPEHLRPNAGNQR